MGMRGAARSPSANTPPAALIDAFRALDANNTESLAPLLVEDGFDAEAIRVLAAWPHTECPWTAPARACPDEGRPTQAAWRWLMSGLDVDVTAIADLANVSCDIAKDKLRILISSRLVYPGGDISAAGHTALRAAVAERVRAGRDKKPPKSKVESDAEDAN